MKRKNTILLQISGDSPNRNVCVTCTQRAEGYYLGEMYILGITHHIEAIQIDKDDNVINPAYQNRWDRYCESNEGLVPQTVTIGRRTFFINIEAYAL